MSDLLGSQSGNEQLQEICHGMFLSHTSRCTEGKRSSRALDRGHGSHPNFGGSSQTGQQRAQSCAHWKPSVAGENSLQHWLLGKAQPFSKPNWCGRWSDGFTMGERWGSCRQKRLGESVGTPWLYRRLGSWCCLVGSSQRSFCLWSCPQITRDSLP